MTQDQSDPEITHDGEEPSERSGELKKELSSIWRSTLDQLDEIKDAIVRSSDAGRAKLDATFLARQRDKLLRELGLAWLAQMEDEAEDPPEEVASMVQRIRELDQQIADHEEEVGRFLGKDPGDEDESP